MQSKHPPARRSSGGLLRLAGIIHATDMRLGLHDAVVTGIVLLPPGVTGGELEAVVDAGIVVADTRVGDGNDFESEVWGLVRTNARYFVPAFDGG